jgi:hypothetical protein
MRIEFENESGLMRFFRKLHLDSIAWAIRRFHVPVGKSDLVLEVGSGGNPYPRANVLLDAYENTRERFWVPLTADRPTVIGFAENLPFKDKSFDFIISAHVLEHSKDPSRFLEELQRVGKAGYIEVPDAIFERLNPYRDHRLEITSRNGGLLITKKMAWIHDEHLVELYENKLKAHFVKILMPKKPFDFHVRYYWSDVIDFEITNPDVDLNWVGPQSEALQHKFRPMARLKEFVRIALRNFLSDKKNDQINIVPLLRCSKCYADVVKHTQSELTCKSCGEKFPIRNGLVVMNER